MDPYTHPATHYTPSGAFPKTEPPKGLIYARNAARVAFIIAATVWLGLMLTHAIEKAAHGIKRAETFSALYESGF